MITIEDIVLVESGQFNDAAIKRLQASIDNGDVWRVWTPYNNNLFLRNVGILVRGGLLKCDAIKSLNTEEMEN